MDALLTSFNSIAPMFVLTGVGYLISKKTLISTSALKEMNTVCFYVFLGALCFNSIYTSNLEDAFSKESLLLIVFCVLGDIALHFIGYVIAPHISRDPTHQSILVQCFHRTNLLVVGYPIAVLLYEDVGIVSVIFALLIPLNNVLGVMAFERYRSGHVSPKKMARAILTNPFVTCTLAAILCRVLHIKLPYFMNSAILSLAAIGSGLALVILGSFFNAKSAGLHKRIIAVACGIRLIIVPFLMLVLAVFLGLRGIQLLCVMIVFVCPVATPVFTMAEQMGADSNLACEAIVFTTLFSCITLFFWIFILKTLHFI